MANLRQLRTEVRDLLGDPASESTTWTDAQVDAAINAACLNYGEKTGVTYVETRHESYGDGQVSLPEPCVKVIRVLWGEMGEGYPA